jgi:hypothetical protein
MADRERRVPEPKTAPLFVAVPQRELDALLAVRRWFHEGTAAVKVPLPTIPPDHEHLEPLKARLVAEALRILSSGPAAQEATPVV